MELGTRIRAARQELGLSQRQLCGEEITRNMLSQIENGSARPSMATLQYLAQKLGKPISWFLEEETVTSPNRELLETVRGFYAAGEYSCVLEQQTLYQGPDPVFDGEWYLLQLLSHIEQAKKALSAGKAVYARGLLEKAQKFGSKTPYFHQALQREWTLCMGQAQPDKAGALLGTMPTDDRELLLRAHGSILAKEYEAACACLEACRNRSARWHYMRGQCSLGMKDYQRAVEYLLQAEATYPKACATALEHCYRELEDYKMAYRYACKIREL